MKISTARWHTRKVAAPTHHATDAAATGCGLELAAELLDGAGRVEAFGQQDDAVQEEE